MSLLPVFGSNVTIKADEGHNQITSSGSNITIKAGSPSTTGYNTISSSGNNVTITSNGSGNHIISSSGNDITITSGTGNDKISSTGDHILIRVDDGTNLVTSSSGTYVNIYSGNANDVISAGNGQHIIMVTNDGDDKLYTFRNKNDGDASNITLDAGNGNDYLSNDAAHDVIMNGGSGNDQFFSSLGTDVTMNCGDGDDTVENYDPNVTIYGGDGNDSIANFGNTAGLNGYTSINGGAGDDTIRNEGDEVTITGGAGNDYIYGSTRDGSVYQYNAGDGKDTITGFQANDTLVMGGGIYTTVKYQDHLVACIGDGYIIIRDYADKMPIIQGTLGDSSKTTVPDINKITSSTDSTVKGVSLYNHNNDTLITCNDNSDYIRNEEGKNVTINSYDGSDNIYNYMGYNAKINAGEGNDTIFSGGADITINGGVGDDSISNHGDSQGFVYQYNLGDGNDTISNFSASDTLIVAADSYTTTQSGNDLIIGVGEGSILLVYVNNRMPKIQLNSNYTGVTETPSENITPSIFSYQSGNDTINNFNSGDKLNFDATYTDWITSGNDFIINAAQGSVHITDAQNKLIELADANGNLISHVYLAQDYEGVIDGRCFGAFEVIMGSDHVNNQIYADAAGSSLWGGRVGSDDALYGNLGIDEYIYSYSNGHDNIFQSGNEDTLNLLNMNLEQISGAMFTDEGTYFKFTDGGSLNISGQVGTFKVGGQTYGADYQNKNWYEK